MSRRNECKDEVRNLIEQHRGLEDRISSKEINNQIRVDTSDTMSNTRDIIRYLIFAEGVPIGSNGQRYYYIEDAEDLEATMVFLDKKITALMQRKRALRYALDGTSFHEEEFEKETL